jgi:hypothetical protein
MKKVIRLTESDLIRIVKRVINEQPSKEEPTKIKSPYILDKVETAIKITGKITKSINQTNNQSK